MLRLAVLPLLTSLIVTPGAAQTRSARPEPDLERTAAQLRDRAGTDATAYEFVEGLTTEIGPRQAGTPAERRAAEWAAARMRRLGFDRVSIEEFPLAAWVRGEEQAVILGASPQRVELDALGGSSSTPPGGIEAEVVIFDTLEALQAAPAGSLRGRIAMVNRRMTRTQTGQGYGPVSAGRSGGPRAAAQAGAVAFLLRSAGTDSHRFAHTGATAYPEGRQPIPSAAVSNPDADQIERLARRGPVRMRLVLNSTLQTASRSQNVVAEIRGRERPDEVVLLGCHLDSWDQGTGAIDDAAGCAIVTGAAKLIADLPRNPRRTIRVVLFGAEEVSQPGGQGLSGARFHAARADAPNIVLAAESDFGAGRIYSVQLPAAAAGTEFARAFARVILPTGALFDASPATGSGPDIGPLIAAHRTPPAELQQDGTDYFDFHHTPDDTLDKIKPEALRQNVAVWAAFAWMAAESGVDFRGAPAPTPTPTR
ncbi:MAG: M28 family peptidase [Proteobacteria bacterium]|nr:M28 family peptidase [Pseudomonadota bacterium]